MSWYYIMHTPCHLGCKHEMNVLTVGIPRVVCASRETKTSSCIADQPPWGKSTMWIQQAWIPTSQDWSNMIKHHQTHVSEPRKSIRIYPPWSASFLHVFHHAVPPPRCSSTKPPISWCGRRWTVSAEKPRCWSQWWWKYMVPIKTKIPMFNRTW